MIDKNYSWQVIPSRKATSSNLFVASGEARLEARLASSIQVPAFAALSEAQIPTAQQAGIYGRTGDSFCRLPWLLL